MHVTLTVPFSLAIIIQSYITIDFCWSFPHMFHALCEDINDVNLKYLPTFTNDMEKVKLKIVSYL